MPLALAVDDTWRAALPVVWALGALMVLDVVSGILVAIREKVVCSSASFRGMLKKGMVLVVIGLLAVVDPVIPDLPVLKLGASFFCVTESLSVLENAGRVGVRLPRWLRGSLRKLADEPQEKL